MDIASVFSNRTVAGSSRTSDSTGFDPSANDVRRFTIVARQERREIMPVLEEDISTVYHRKHHGLDIVTVQVEARITPGAHGARVCGVYIARRSEANSCGMCRVAMTS